MPYSSNPVYVSPGDNVQVRYPTPDTWNTQVTVNLRIGTGQDPDGITFGTKIPDATPAGFTFTDQQGYLNAYDGNSNNTLTGGRTTFERDTTYYSNLIEMSGFEVPIDGAISAVSNGPKNSNTSNTTAEFRIFRDGSFDSWRTTISGNLAEGTGGIQPGDKIQLRVTTPDWYITWTRVTFSVNETTTGGGLGSEYTAAGVTSSAILTGTWDISTRPQDQSIPASEINFTDRVDMVPYSEGGPQYYYHRVDITNIDDDAVLRVSTTGVARVVKVEGGGNAAAPTSGYSTSLTGVVLGDDVFVRMPNGTNYTEKESGSITVFAQGGETYTRGSNSYENVDDGTTYGSGTYAVSQTLGSVTDNWQIWTEVDRYPDAIAATPIFTYGIKTEIVSVGGVAVTGSGFNYTGTFSTTTNGSGEGMKIKLLPGGSSGTSFSTISEENGYTTAFISDPGYDYVAGDIVTIISPGGSNAQIRILEYEKITISKTVDATCEPGFMYFADMPVSGLGTEYTDGAYDDLESPYTNLQNTILDDTGSSVQSINANLDGQSVKIRAIIDGTGGEIRKNNTGAWTGSQITVENGDTINLKLNSNSTFGGTATAKVRIIGPTAGNPDLGNPTGGPSPASKAEKQTTMTLTTRSRRVIPYPFHAEPVFLSNPNQEHIAEVAIEGLDVQTNAEIVNNGVGDLSTNGSNWSNSVTIQPTDTTLYVRTNAATNSGGVKELTYRIYRDGQEAYDTFRIYTRLFNNLGFFGFLQADGDGANTYQTLELPYYATQDFYVTLVGAGGGRGGDDAPNSQGAGGGSGNFLRLRVQRDDFPDQPGFPGVTDGRVRVYAPDKGGDGQSYIQGAGGGAGGWGYAMGGAGGDSGNGDKSGAGGGGGGAAAITMLDGTLIAMAGGGGGGAGAGNDTEVPRSDAFGNWDGYGSLQTTTTDINLGGDDAPDATGSGAGPGGGGGGYDGTAGTLFTQKLDADGNVIQTTDLDARGGLGGGAYYDSTNTVILAGTTLDGLGAPPGQFGRVIIEYGPQDVTPDDFDFDQVDSVNINTQVVSSRALIQGITGKVPIQLSSPGFTATARVCTSDTDASCGAWGATQIGNNEYLQLRATTGTSYNTPYEVQVEVGETTSTWVINTGPPPDTTVNFFQFTDAEDAPLSTLTTSEVVTISGINVPVEVTASGGAEIKIYNSDNTVDLDWTSGSTANYIENNQKLQIRVTSSADYSDDVDVVVTVGTGSNSEDIWTVTTLDEIDTEPEAFSFLDVSNANPNTTYTSNVNVIEGLGGPTYFQIDYGDNDQSDSSTPALAIILLDGIEQLNSSGDPLTYIQVENNDQISLKYTTTGVLGEPREFITRTGGTYNTTTQEVEGSTDYPVYETDWKVTTAGSFVSNPAAFTFQTVLASGAGVDTNSVEVPSISGLGQVTPVVTTNGLKVSINGGTFNPSSGEYTVNNGNTIQVQLESSEIPGFTRTGSITIGNYTTSFTVQTPAAVQDPIKSQWYSSIQPVKYLVAGANAGSQIRFDTKFDGLPIGSMIPVFQDATQSDNWGDLDGEFTSRFPGMLYCDGSYVEPEDYPMLFALLQYRYGAEAVTGETFTTTLYDVNGNILKEDGDAKILMRLPDLRNRYLKGTGVIDGTQLSSPGLAPTYQPTKLAGAPGNQSPGAFGGMWYVDTIGDPGSGELEQVQTPAEGLPANESDYFGIAQVQTTGYTDVSGNVEFLVSGSCVAQVSLKKQKVYDVPLHFHELVTGQKDQGAFKGRVNWGSDGGFRSPAASASETFVGKLSTTYEYERQYGFNQWGYLTRNDVYVPDNNLPRSAYCPGKSTEWWDGSTEDWSDPSGYQGISDIGNPSPNPQLVQPNMLAVDGAILGVDVTSSSATSSGGTYSQVSSSGGGGSGATFTVIRGTTAATTGGDIQNLSIGNAVAPDVTEQVVYEDITATPGANVTGTGAVFAVLINTNNTYSVQATTGGSGYNVGDTLTIPGTTFADDGGTNGGTDSNGDVIENADGSDPPVEDANGNEIVDANGVAAPDNSITITVSAVGPASSGNVGEVVSVTVNSGGSGYTSGGTVTLAAGNVGGSAITLTINSISSSGAYGEINNYIDVTNSPWPGNGSSDFNGVVGAYKQFTSVDIPEKQATIKGYNPESKLFHTHYVSLSAPFDDDGEMYSYGNYDTYGNKSAGLNTNASTHGLESVNLEFNSIADLGVQVLPGTFTLSQTKQLIPTPSLTPQDEVALMSPYTWTKWLIKAY